MPQYIVFDVGGTNLKYALMNENAEILAKGEFPTPMDKGKEGFLEATVEYALRRPDLRDKFKAYLEGLATKGM